MHTLDACSRDVLFMDVLEGKAATGGVAKASESDGVFGAHCADMHKCEESTDMCDLCGVNQMYFLLYLSC